MWIIVLWKYAGGCIDARSKVGIYELRTSKVTRLDNGVPTFWCVWAKKDNAGESCRELTTSEPCPLKAQVRERAILKLALQKMSRKIGCAPLESAAGKNAPLELGVRVDVNMKESAIVPTAIGKTSPIKCRAVIDGPGGILAAGNG